MKISPADPTVDRTALAPLLSRGLRLEYTTLGWNVVGVVIVVAAALQARSVALAGFGLDSLIEIFASVVVVWQLRGIGKDRERRALWLIGLAFLALAVYLLGQLLVTLVAHIHPAPSPLGFKDFYEGMQFGGDVVIQPGMEFQFEPNAVFGRDYVDVGGNIIVTQTGCEALNVMPTEMRIVR